MYSIPEETSWIKAKAFTWSTKQRYSATILVFFALICIAWFIAFKPLHVHKKKATFLAKECSTLEQKIHTLHKNIAHIKETLRLNGPQPTDTYALLACLTGLLESAGVVLESYSTYQRKKGSAPLFKLKVTGDFEAFLRLLELLKNETTKIRLKKITVMRQQHMRLQASIELQAETALFVLGAQV